MAKKLFKWRQRKWAAILFSDSQPINCQSEAPSTYAAPFSEPLWFSWSRFPLHPGPVIYKAFIRISLCPGQCAIDFLFSCLFASASFLITSDPALPHLSVLRFPWGFAPFASTYWIYFFKRISPLCDSMITYYLKIAISIFRFNVLKLFLPVRRSVRLSVRRLVVLIGKRTFSDFRLSCMTKSPNVLRIQKKWRSVLMASHRGFVISCL